MLSKGVLWKSPNNPDCCQDKSLLSIDWHQGSITDDNTQTTHWTWRSQVGSYIDLSVLCCNVLSMRRYQKQSTKKEMKCIHQPSHKTFDLQCCPACKIHEAMACGSNQSMSWLKAYSMRRNSCLASLGWWRTRD